MKALPTSMICLFSTDTPPYLFLSYIGGSGAVTPLTDEKTNSHQQDTNAHAGVIIEQPQAAKCSSRDTSLKHTAVDNVLGQKRNYTLQNTLLSQERPKSHNCDHVSDSTVRWQRKSYN